MKLNNFFFPKSYLKNNKDLVIKSLRDLTEACTRRTPCDDFYHDDTLYHFIATEPSFYEIDGELFHRIVPQTLKMMKICGEINNNIEKINNKYSEDINSLWGCFNVNDIFHNSNIDEYLKHRKLLIDTHMSGSVFKEWRALSFPTIKFANDALKQIEDLGNSSIFKKIYEGLLYFEKYNMSWNKGGFQLSSLSKVSRFSVSDESETVKHNPHLKRYRLFNLPDNLGSKYCFYHMKINSENQNWRIHFYPDNDGHRIYIAYVGCHLKLQ